MTGIADEPHAKFGVATPLPMDAFHTINAATVRHAATTNDDLLKLLELRPMWETLAPSSVTPHLLRRILSDDTAIHTLIQERDDDARAVADLLLAARRIGEYGRVMDEDTVAELVAWLVRAADAVRGRFANRIAELEQRDTPRGTIER